MRTAKQKRNATAITKQFALPHPVDTVEPFGKGLINDTFLVAAGGSRYILQRINDSVFPAAERIMSNLTVLEKHLAGQPRAGLRIPALIPSRDGQPFARGGDGAVWRLMEFIPDTETLQRIETQDQAREVGRILGRFHASTSELSPDRLVVTLPGFHVTPAYLERFKQVLNQDPSDRSDAIRSAVTFVTERQAGATVLEDARRGGRIPLRVIHGDPKLDNILFDRARGHAVALVDLDTVQPGLLHHDLGDCLRSCCNRGGESPCGHRSAGFDLHLCRAILGAYAKETGGILGTAEVGLLFDAIRLIPFELGLRFLTDHLEGDRYFRVAVRGQNLRKAGVQFALVEDIECKEREIGQIIDECFRQPKS